MRSGAAGTNLAVAALTAVLFLGISCGAADGASGIAAVDSPTAPATPAPTESEPSAAGATTTSTSGAAGPPTTAPEELNRLPSLDGFVVAIDPGHNGQNWRHSAEIAQQVDIGTKTKECDTTGTQTADGYTESAFALDLSHELRTLLEDVGATVVLTRWDDASWGPCITDRAAVGNDAGADAAISIHADGGPEDGSGFHVIYPVSVPGLTDDIATDSERLALALYQSYADGSDMPVADYIATDGLSRRDDLGGLNLSDVPKVFIETGNMRNEADAARLSDPDFRARAAGALAAGIATFLVDPTGSPEPNPQQ